MSSLQEATMEITMKCESDDVELEYSDLSSGCHEEHHGDIKLDIKVEEAVEQSSLGGACLPLSTGSIWEGRRDQLNMLPCSSLDQGLKGENSPRLSPDLNSFKCSDAWLSDGNRVKDGHRDNYDCDDRVRDDHAGSCDNKHDSDSDRHGKVRGGTECVREEVVPLTQARRSRSTRVSCHVCGEKFSKLVLMEQHVRSSHSGEKPHVCETCGKQYSTISAMYTHCQIHTGKRSHICKICGRSFFRQDSMRRHRNTHADCGLNGCSRDCSDIRRRLYDCDLCGKSFMDPYNLKRHYSTHTDVRPHECDVCGKGFTQNGDMKRHRLTHSDAKPNKCDHCGRCFGRKYGLTLHLRIHSGERAYKCHCGKTFSRRDVLVGHERAHTGVYPYSCFTCGASFSAKCLLVVHCKYNKH